MGIESDAMYGDLLAQKNLVSNFQALYGYTKPAVEYAIGGIRKGVLEMEEGDPTIDLLLKRADELENHLNEIDKALEG